MGLRGPVGLSYAGWLADLRDLLVINGLMALFKPRYRIRVKLGIRQVMTLAHMKQACRRVRMKGHCCGYFGGPKKGSQQPRRLFTARTDLRGVDDGARERSSLPTDGTLCRSRSCEEVPGPLEQSGWRLCGPALKKSTRLGGWLGIGLYAMGLL